MSLVDPNNNFYLNFAALQAACPDNEARFGWVLALDIYVGLFRGNHAPKALRYPETLNELADILPRALEYGATDFGCALKAFLHMGAGIYVPREDIFTRKALPDDPMEIN